MILVSTYQFKKSPSKKYIFYPSRPMCNLDALKNAPVTFCHNNKKTSCLDKKRSTYKIHLVALPAPLALLSFSAEHCLPDRALTCAMGTWVGRWVRAPSTSPPPYPPLRNPIAEEKCGERTHFFNLATCAPQILTTNIDFSRFFWIKNSVLIHVKVPRLKDDSIQNST